MRLGVVVSRGHRQLDAHVAGRRGQLRELGDGQRRRRHRGETEFEVIWAEHERLSLDPNARNLRHTYVQPGPDSAYWRVQQMLVDPEGHNDWVAEYQVDLDRSRQEARPVMRLLRLGPLTLSSRA